MTSDPSFENSPAPTPPSTLPELIEVLTSQNAEARIGAAHVLSDMGPEAKPAIAALIENLSYQESYEVRMAVAETLGSIGPEAKAAIPALTTVLLNDFVQVRRASAVALGQIGDVSTLPVLAKALYDKDTITSIDAAESMEKLSRRKLLDADVSVRYLQENGIPKIVLAARIWWEQEGQYQDWTDTK
jgi:HEAT repeat protein